MLRYLMILILALPIFAHGKNDPPERLLGRYMDYVVASQWDQIHSLMYPQDVENLQKLLLRIIAFENQFEESRMQQIIFGESVSNETAGQYDAQFYLARIYRGLALVLRQQGFELRSHEVLGHVKEGRERVHLLVRMTLSQRGSTVSNLQIYSFRKKDRKWFMELQPNITEILELLEHKYEMRQ